MPTGKYTGAPACKHRRPSAGTACKPILACRIERCCVGSVGACWMLAACICSDAAWALMSAYGAALLSLAVGGRLW